MVALTRDPQWAGGRRSGAPCRPAAGRAARPARRGRSGRRARRGSRRAAGHDRPRPWRGRRAVAKARAGHGNPRRPVPGRATAPARRAPRRRFRPALPTGPGDAGRPRRAATPDWLSGGRSRRACAAARPAAGTSRGDRRRIVAGIPACASSALSSSGVATVAPRRNHARRVMPRSGSTSSRPSSCIGLGGCSSGPSRW